MTSSPRVSVVISTQDRPVELMACLDSLRRAVGDDDEIVVVDSASRDPDAVRDVVEAAGMHLIRLEEGGSARARNYGIQHSKGRIIAFTDDDAVVDSEWVNEIVGGFSDPDVDIVLGPVFQMGTSPPKLLLEFSTIDPTERTTLDRSAAHWFAKLNLGAIGSGANLAVRRSLFERHGAFRVGLGQGAPIPGDENYFLFSAVQAGATVLNQPSAIIYHPQQSGQRLAELRQGSVAFLFYLAARHPLRLPHIAGWLASKLADRRSGSGGEETHRGGWLIPALINAPAKLIASWRFDRAG